ncbi:oligosaccharyltransferase complex subunit epsilon [Xylographa opegraphella]|nr:oligosaccharyltransferase complex subunit epsilon [Xylographa opegraphella]
MAPKNRSANTPNTSTATPTTNIPTASRAPTRDGSMASKGKATTGGAPNLYEIMQGVWDSYVDKTPQRTKLVDVFMAFLVVVGGVQFVYCVLAGNYPFNAFLAGFSATVGQFVLTAGLRMQTNLENKTEFSTVSPERYVRIDHASHSVAMHIGHSGLSTFVLRLPVISMPRIVTHLIQAEATARCTPR